jgi:phosphomannomutase
MIKFGTSGFRGIIGESFTKQNIQKIGYAIFKVLKKENKTDKIINVGFDNRFMGKIFAGWICEVLAFNGLKTRLFQYSVPSPLIAFETKNNHIGIQITASHNHYYYNGIKIFLKQGRDSDDEFNNKIMEIANEVDFSEIKTLNLEEAIEQKLVLLVQDITPYCNSIIKFINPKLTKKKKLKVLINAFHGSTVECIKHIFKQIGFKSYEIMKGELDPYFEYKIASPYVNNLDDQVKKLKKEKFDVGFALDADGDRVSFIDKDGKVYDCNFISAILYYYFIKNKKTKGNIVKNTALTELTAKIAEHFKFKAFNANVGFKNIAKILINKESNAIIGVESNGIAINQHIPYKDGLLPIVLMLEILLTENKSIKEIIDEIKQQVNYPCEVLEFAYPITDEKKSEIMNKVFKEKTLPETPDEIINVDYSDGFKISYKNDYWGVIRFSGTENVVRIFAEMKNKKECSKYIQIYENFIGVNKRQV